jgi:uncharacterized membrane protein
MANIRNPLEWGADQFKDAASHLQSVGQTLVGSEAGTEARRPAVRRIEVADLRDVLAKGIADFGAFRTDVIFLCIIYPVVGLILARFASDYGLLPLLFPVASGFALLGPVAAVGLYEMSRRREAGLKASWSDAFGMIRSPSFGAILVLGLLLLVIFLIWLAAAQVIYWITLGPAPPASPVAFVHDVLATGAGWAMIILGMTVGFFFAVFVLAISVVSFPLLLRLGADRHGRPGAGVHTAVPGPDLRHARARPRHLASLSQSGRAMSASP